MRSQPTNFGKNNIRYSKKGPFGLINGTFKFVCSHNENTHVSDFVNPVKLPEIQCAYYLINLLMPGTYPHTG